MKVFLTTPFLFSNLKKVDFQSLDQQVRHALEIRHPSWINDQAVGILREFNIALCMADTAGRHPSCESMTADFVYIRLHGSRKRYASQYSEEELRAWAKKVDVCDFMRFSNNILHVRAAGLKNL